MVADDRYVLDFDEIDGAQVALVGGKGANLGELSRIDGISVPPGCCVTTDAFALIVAAASIEDQLARLSHMQPDEREAIRSLSAEVRRAVEGVEIPAPVATAISAALTRLGGETAAYAVRSSATAEDLPTASFAGQQDTYLNVVGPAAILDHVSRCWASLFTERAVTYRLQNGFREHDVGIAVVIQRMVVPRASGVVFTADPVTGNRKIVVAEACFGLGEALVSGHVDADVYRVRDGELVETSIAVKRSAVRPSASGGTTQEVIEPGDQGLPALTDAEARQLARAARQIESHFASPQDIEWCLDDDGFHIVQTRPITTLFPVPQSDDDENHVYVSVGHQQMMTDPIKPLGLSLFQLTAMPKMYEAGGRLFVDVTPALASPASRDAVLGALGTSDPLIGDALATIIERGDFIRMLPAGSPGGMPHGAMPNRAALPPLETDRAVVAELIEINQASVGRLRNDIATKSGPALLEFILTDVLELKRLLFDPRSHQVFMSAIEATSWLNENLQTWLGEKNAADVLTQSVPDNITSEMGLALLDVADAIRPHPAVVTFLQSVDDEGFLDRLADVNGGAEAHRAITAFLDTYGMRCVGEIDITRPRWSQQPTALLPIILANIRNFTAGAGAERFERGLREARAEQQDVLARLRGLPDGAPGAGQADEVERMIARVRTFIGYREYPKYGMVCRYAAYKQALMGEADRLVHTGVVGDREDIFFLTFQELQDVVRTQRVDDGLISGRKAAFSSYRGLTPPRVLTSDGEAMTGSYRRSELPDGALVGLPVSAGTIDGRARVVLDMADADLQPGDILVTTFTDPSWTPLFVAIAGLVAEVGGLMTHGAVIAREYGLPAVVGVEHATRLIRDGQRIRVHGTEGYVEILG